MARTIATIGYEGASISDFVAALKQAKVKIVIDVRELPLSRKKGFSKNQLADFLVSQNILYIHLRGLGDPKEGRIAARAGQFKLFEKIFSSHMKSEVAQRDLEKAIEIVNEKYACLMCYEADHETCHRSIVADHIAEKTGLTINHLAVQSKAVDLVMA